MVLDDVAASYEEEVAGIGSAYAAARKVNAAWTAREVVRGRSAYVVASGGAAPAAEFVAQLHRTHVGSTVEVLSPLRFVERSELASSAVLILLSARARHPDTAFAAAHAQRRGIAVLLITQRPAEELSGPLAHPAVTVVTVPAVREKDGFLATQSVVAMCVVAAGLYGEQLPDALNRVAHLPQITKAQPLIVLHAEEGRPAAIDVEVRFHELGLGSVEVVDYRNFAHGRHVGVDRRSSHATVLALTTPESEPLAKRTLKVVPKGIRVTQIASLHAGARGALELLVSVMRLPVPAARDQQLRLDRPPVPGFGRELYHLPFKRMYPPAQVNAVSRKLNAIGANPTPAMQTVTTNAYKAWRSWVSRQNIHSLVLDYDGTVVSTAGRYNDPEPAVRMELLRLLRNGIQIGFATGRGDSLTSSLQRWVPADLHGQITLGLHNGSWVTSLTPMSADPIVDTSWISQVLAALQPYEQAGVLQVRASSSQISIKPEHLGTSVRQAHEIVTAALLPLLHDVRIAASGHSVDVIGANHGKERFLKLMEDRFGSALAIGDQGAYGGNDFVLLGSTRLSVSVADCSADLTRCWNIARPGLTGPGALVDVLSLVQLSGQGFKLRPKPATIGLDVHSS